MPEKIVAYILINAEVGRENDIVGEIIDKFSNAVTEARTTYGDFDVVVRLEVSSMRALDGIVSGIRKIPGVVRTVTLIAS